jgi:hypothetical protein
MLPASPSLSISLFTTAQTAPLAKASAKKFAPLKFSPGMAKKQSPALVVRESVLMPVKTRLILPPSLKLRRTSDTRFIGCAFIILAKSAIKNFFIFVFEKFIL